jgi:hypothetical protein
MTHAYSFLRTFGCAYWPNLRPYNNHKLAFQSKQYTFLGYSVHHKGYKCHDVSTGRVYISRDVVFDESVFPFSKLHSNAGTRLRSEISLLPSSLIDPMMIGGNIMNDTNICMPPNSSLQHAPVLVSSGATPAANWLILSPHDHLFLPSSGALQPSDHVGANDPGTDPEIDFLA